MLDYLGEKEASMNILNAINKTLEAEECRTKDLGGNCSTIECSKAIVDNL